MYKRTEQGQWAAFSSESALPRKLRSLLKIVNGNTETEVYIKTLQAFGDVRVLLESLRIAGLLSLDDEADATGIPRDPYARDHSAWDKTAPGGLDALPDSHLSDQSMMPQPPRFGARPAPTPPVAFDPRLGQDSRTAAPSSVPFGRASRYTATQLAPDHAEHDAMALGEIKRSMSDYILAHIPQDAFQLLAEVEGLTSLEDVFVMLPGYEMLITHTGAAKAVHVQAIRHMMGH